jgi:carboxyl-terminal processing protease
VRVDKFILYIVISFSLAPRPAYVKNVSGVPVDSLGKINKWLYDSMRLYYYWADDMPAHPDYSLSTPDFFKQLLSPKDRFSWISDRSTIEQPKSAAELYGFHYRLITHPFNSGQLTGIITCVVPRSQAATKGLQRGMLFTKVNNKIITTQNRLGVMHNLQAPSVLLQLSVFNNDRSALVDSVRIAMQSSYVPQKSVYATRMFEQEGKRTGYLAYFLCAESQDAILVQSVAKLKKAGITECILDLRYNSGGSVASATKLAAMLVPVFNPSQTFITYTGNKHGGTIKQSFQRAISFSGHAAGKNMHELQSLNLHLRRIYVLTSSTTGSAAEILANNLLPFMQVIRIGETTLGKDEAFFLIEDLQTPKQVNWIMMPTIYKIADARGSGNYAGGLVPDHPVVETSHLPLPALGLPGDRLVDESLKLIYGKKTAVQVYDLF